MERNRLDDLQLKTIAGDPDLESWAQAVYPSYLEGIASYDAMYEKGEDGLWRPDYLPFWFTDATADPLAFLLDNQPVGFGFVGIKPFPYMSSDVDMRIAEFFVLSAYRRCGIGRRAACKLFDSYHGVWEVTQLIRHKAAQAFWLDVIGAYTNGNFAATVSTEETRQIFRTPHHDSSLKSAANPR